MVNASGGENDRRHHEQRQAHKACSEIEFHSIFPSDFSRRRPKRNLPRPTTLQRAFGSLTHAAQIVLERGKSLSTFVTDFCAAGEQARGQTIELILKAKFVAIIVGIFKRGIFLPLLINYL